MNEENKQIDIDLADTSSILNEVNKDSISSAIKTKKENKMLNIIVTIIMGILIIYAGGYTLYYVFLVPYEQAEEEINDETINLINIANENLNKIPYIFNVNSAYSSNKMTYGLLSKDLINSYMVNEITNTDGYNKLTTPDFIEFSELNCSDVNTTHCFAILVNDMELLAKSYYGSSVMIDKSNFTFNGNQSNRCDIYNEYYFCTENINNLENYQKLSKIETVKLNEEYIYIYETAAFINNFSDENNILEIENVSNTPDMVQYVINNVKINYEGTNYNDAFINMYSSKLKLYKHTFLIQSEENYTWLSTEIVKSIEE